jgi:hypothetical protein
MAELTARQRADIATAVRHLGRAMRALDRAGLPDADTSALRELHDGQRAAGEASDHLIAGLVALDGPEHVAPAGGHHDPCALASTEAWDLLERPTKPCTCGGTP